MPSFIWIYQTVWPCTHSTPTLQTGHTEQDRQTDNGTIEQGEPFYKRSSNSGHSEYLSNGQQNRIFGGLEHKRPFRGRDPHGHAAWEAYNVPLAGFHGQGQGRKEGEG